MSCAAISRPSDRSEGLSTHPGWPQCAQNVSLSGVPQFRQTVGASVGGVPEGEAAVTSVAAVAAVTKVDTPPCCTRDLVSSTASHSRVAVFVRARAQGYISLPTMSL